MQNIILPMFCFSAHYETFGISKLFPIKLQVVLIRAKTLDNSLTAKCFIYDVCALNGKYKQIFTFYCVRKSRECKSLMCLGNPSANAQGSPPGNISK